MQNTKSHVDSLFNGFEETKILTEFKEELTGHLNEKIANLVKKGVNEMEAFQKAVTELGDISAIADEMSLKKKQEIYSDMYMGTRKYLTPKRTALFILGGFLVCFGIIVAAMIWFTTGMQHASLASGILFIAAGAGLLNFMGMTQETAVNYPIPWKRALLYAVSVVVFVFGVFSAVLVYFAIISEANPAETAVHGWSQSIQNLGVTSAIGAVIAFMLPSIAFFVFLALTEKDRKKPWAKKQEANEADLFADPQTAMRFGMFSGAIWISAFALFVLIGFLVSFKISWLIFLFATAAQLCVQALMIKKG